MMESRTLVYVYDLSRGLARSLSRSILGRQLDGIWHTGIVVYNQEYFFGGQGVESCAPGHTMLGNPDEVIDLGVTEIPFEVFWDHLHELSKSTFRPRDYNLLQHNCNNFSSELAQFLTGRDIPAHITNLPSEVLGSPFGQMIRPFLESMTVDPGDEVEVCFSSPSQGASQPQHAKQPAISASSAPPAARAVQAITYPLTQELSLSDFKISDRTAITILLDYQKETNPDWSVSPKHLIKLRDAIESEDREVAWRLLQGLVLHSSLTSALYACYDQIKSVLADSRCLNACKTVCNLSSHKEGVIFINEHNALITQELFSSASTSDVLSNQPRVATAFNISNLYEPGTHDIDIALTSGLVEYINTSLINYCVESEQPGLLTQLDTALKALINFMTKNSEMNDLVACLELDMESIKQFTNQTNHQSLKNSVTQMSSLLR